MRVVIFMFFISVIFFTFPIAARPCSPQEEAIAELHAALNVGEIALQDQGEVYVHFEIESCNIVSYAYSITAHLRIIWRGTFSGDFYEKRGSLSFSYQEDDPRAASGITWSESWASQTLLDWRTTKMGFGAAVLLLCLSADKCK